MKKKVGIVFGGIGNENDISIKSAKSIINNIDKNKYDVFNIFIDKDNKWYECENIDDNYEIINKNEITNIIDDLKKYDIIFPILHGIFGEDGKIQSLLELFKIPFVGCNSVCSSIGMDKEFTKILLSNSGILQTKYVCLKKKKDEYIYVDEKLNEISSELKNICNIINSKLSYPLFIKPCNSGSSIGINYANNYNELVKYIEEASLYDDKIIIEENINGREVECGIIGNDELLISSIGEIKSNNCFYSYDEKYKKNDFECVIPSTIDYEISKEIKRLSKKIYKLLGCKGLSRLDFFVEDKTNKIYFNEINTMPGFTDNSMFPRLFEDIKYPELIDKLLSLSLKNS